MLRFSLPNHKSNLQFVETVPIDTARQCLDIRQGRIGIDVVRDAVELELEREIEVRRNSLRCRPLILDSCPLYSVGGAAQPIPYIIITSFYAVGYWLCESTADFKP